MRTIVRCGLFFALLPSIVGGLAVAQSDEPEAVPAKRPPPRLLVSGRLGAEPDWCRDWPVVLTVRSPEPGLTLVVRRGGKPVEWPWRTISPPGSDQPVGWALPAGALAAEPAGTVEVELRRGEEVVGRTDLKLALAPETPSPEFEKQAFYARLAHAGASGDKAAALAVASEFAARFPEDPDAHVAMGDALAAAGRDAEALPSYRRAIALSGDGLDPPEHVLTRYHEVLGRLLGEAPTRPAAPPTEAELAFFAAVDAGDAALRKGDYAEAAYRYERALREHRKANLSQDAALIEERLAAVRKLAEAAKRKKEGK